MAAMLTYFVEVCRIKWELIYLIGIVAAVEKL